MHLLNLIRFENMNEEKRKLKASRYHNIEWTTKYLHHQSQSRKDQEQFKHFGKAFLSHFETKIQ